MRYGVCTTPEEVYLGKILPVSESESCSVVSDSLRPPWDSPGQNTGVGSLSLLQGIFPTQASNPGLPHCRQILYQLESEVAQSCPTLCDPVDCSPPGSSIHGILQAKILEWVAISFSRGSSPFKQLTFYGEQITTEDKPRELLNRVISLQLNGRPDLQRIL